MSAEFKVQVQSACSGPNALHPEPCTLNYLFSIGTNARSAGPT